MGKQKVIVSARALCQRLNRKLAQTNQKLCASRSARVEQDCGRFYVVDTVANVIAFKDVDLEFLGRDLRVLAPWEKMG